MKIGKMVGENILHRYFICFFSLCFNPQVDVIVNTIAPNCDLSQGLISRAILMKAGNKIQDEINKKKHTTPSLARVNLYTTNGYNLKCSAVFHTVCTHRSESKAEQVDFIFISNLAHNLICPNCLNTNSMSFCCCL